MRKQNDLFLCVAFITPFPKMILKRNSVIKHLFPPTQNKRWKNCSLVQDCHIGYVHDKQVYWTEFKLLLASCCFPALFRRWMIEHHWSSLSLLISGLMKREITPANVWSIQTRFFFFIGVCKCFQNEKGVML